MTDRTYKDTLVEYEEDNANTRVYKFEVKRDREGEWLPAGSGSEAKYRVVGRRMQFYWFKEGTPAAERAELEGFLQRLDPLPDNGVLEVCIGKDAVGYYVRDYRWEEDRPRAAELTELTRDALIRAVAKIDEMLSP